MQKSLVIFLLFLSVLAKAQQGNVPLNQEWLQESEARMVKAHGFPLNAKLLRYESDSAIRQAMRDTANAVIFPLHSSMRPWIEQGHGLRQQVVLQNTFDKRYEARGSFGKWLKRYHNNTSLLQVERKPQNEEPLFRLYVDPLLNLQYMKVKDDTSSDKFYINTRGVTAHGDIGTKISFETSFWENQAFFPKYIADFANSTQVVPGEGRWKKFKKNGYDYAMASGYLSYSPCRFFNVQVGSGKHFVGDGYRSLLLSDNSFSYPYARLSTWFGPNGMFQYTAMYAALMNLTNGNVPIPPGTEHLYQKKAASFQQLSVNLGRVAEVSFFQGLIWQAADDRNAQHLGFRYFDPLIYSGLINYGLGNKNNYLLGGTFHVDVLRTLRIYGQYALDDNGKKGTVLHKSGFQLGAKYYNAFTVKHLHLQFEFNKVNPYTYSAQDSSQAYTHYNQPLAHPLGANFSEVVASMQYKISDFYLQARFSTATLGADTAGYDFGQNVFMGNAAALNTPVAAGETKMGQGQKTTISYYDVSLGYMISYASNLNVCIGVTDRKVQGGATLDHTNYVYMAIRTSLSNTYLDFFSK